MQVDLYESGTIAIVEAVSPELGNRVQRVRVQLPGTSQELLTKFREKKVDFAAHTATEDGGAVFLNLLGASLCEFMYVKLPVWSFVFVVVESRCGFASGRHVSACLVLPCSTACMSLPMAFVISGQSKLGPVCCKCCSICCLRSGQ